GMVAGLRPARDHHHHAMSVQRGAGDGFEQVGFADVERARAREQKSARVEHFERAQVEFLVASQGRLDVRLLARERRRVKHDGVEALAFLVSGLQEVEAIGFLPLDVREAVQLLVAARERERARGNLDSEDRLALWRQGQRKSASVAEAIEQAPARVLLRRGAVLALIEKAPGL